MTATDPDIVRKTWSFVMLDNKEAVEYIRAEAGPALGRMEADLAVARRLYGVALRDHVSLIRQAADAEAERDRLRVAANGRLSHGHNDTCQSVLDTVESYPCNCGHNALVAALKENT